MGPLPVGDGGDVGAVLASVGAGAQPGVLQLLTQFGATCGQAWDVVQNVDRWFVINETGELVIARFTPAGYEEIDRTLLLEPTTRTRGGASGRWDDRAVLWAHPAFANRHVVSRNDVEVVRLSLAAEDYE